MEIFRQLESEIINPDTEMHYAILSSFQSTKFPHSHDFFEFFLLMEGSQELVINEQSLSLNPGALVLIRPNDVHSRRYTSGGFHINIAFSSSIARSMFDYLGNGYPSRELMDSKLPPYINLSHTESKRVQGRMRELYAVSLMDTNLQRTKLRTLILDIFVQHFARCIEQSSSCATWFEHLLLDMERPENLSAGLPAMLELSQKSHEYLCRIFRRKLNCTPTQYINDLRLNYTANYLIHSDIPILDICMTAGFENLSHFYHLFQKKYHMSPKQFRTASVNHNNLFTK